MCHIFMAFDVNWCRLMLFLVLSCIILRWLFYSVFLVVLSCRLFWLIFPSVEHQSFLDFRRRLGGVQRYLNELGFFFILEVLRQSVMPIIFVLLLLCLGIVPDVLGLGLHNLCFGCVLRLIVVFLFHLFRLVLRNFLGQWGLCGRIGHDALAMDALLLALAVLRLINVHNLLRQLLHLIDIIGGIANYLRMHRHDALRSYPTNNDEELADRPR